MNSVRGRGGGGFLASQGLRGLRGLHWWGCSSGDKWTAAPCPAPRYAAPADPGRRHIFPAGSARYMWPTVEAGWWQSRRALRRVLACASASQRQPAGLSPRQPASREWCLGCLGDVLLLAQHAGPQAARLLLQGGGGLRPGRGRRLGAPEGGLLRLRFRPAEASPADPRHRPAQARGPRRARVAAPARPAGAARPAARRPRRGHPGRGLRDGALPDRGVRGWCVPRLSAWTTSSSDTPLSRGLIAAALNLGAVRTAAYTCECFATVPHGQAGPSGGEPTNQKYTCYLVDPMASGPLPPSAACCAAGQGSATCSAACPCQNSTMVARVRAARHGATVPRPGSASTRD